MKFLRRLFHTHDYGVWETVRPIIYYDEDGRETGRSLLMLRVCRVCGAIQRREF